MTIDQFLGLSSIQMHNLTDEELIKYFEPLLKITRPLENKDYVDPTKIKKPRKTKADKEAKINAILAKLKDDEEEEVDEEDEEQEQLMLDFFKE